MKMIQDRYKGFAIVLAYAIVPCRELQSICIHRRYQPWPVTFTLVY